MHKEFMKAMKNLAQNFSNLQKNLTIKENIFLSIILWK